ncbi:MAG: DeoR/GlpR family DNA-binding transcription regulator [Ilumatobacter sp.]
MANMATDAPVTALFQSERQHKIISLTLEAGRVEVSELAARFGVTTETIRRDLSDLQANRVVRRVHGGAVPWETSGFEPLLSKRNDHHEAEKRRLATVAIRELPDEGSVIIDSGSTLAAFAQAVPARTTLRIVTNALNVAQTLCEHTDADVIVVGGKVRKNTLAMVDTQAIDSIEPITVDTLFISADGASGDVGLTTPYREEAALKSAMIASARRVVVLVDHSKFGQEHFVRFANWSDVDVLVTNTEADAATLRSIEAAGVTVVTA